MPPSCWRRELSKPGYVPKMIAIGTNTDPYQPIEKRLRIMRSVLEVLHEFRHPVGIVTKSALVLRDLDILAPMAEQGLVKVALSVTTLDRDLARTMEPRAATPPRRLEAIRESARGRRSGRRDVRAGDPGPERRGTGAACWRPAAKAGAASAGYVLLRLPLEIKDLFREWLAEHAPGRAAHVMSLIRQMRGGKDYDAAWHQRMRGAGPYAQMIARRFHLASRRLGLNGPSKPLDLTKFRRPARSGEQLALL